MTDTPYPARVAQRIDIDSGVPGLALTHHVTECLPDADGVPSNGLWHVTHIASDRTVERCQIGFRTLHAAAHLAQRLAALRDWTVPANQIAFEGLLPEVRHAEAHAHEIDAAWPVGGVIPFSNGPSVVDDDGDLRRFIAQAPSIDWDKADDGTLTCSVCGALPARGYADG